MVKKERTSSNWLRQEINTRLSYIFILLLIMLGVLVAYEYSIPSIGVPIETQIQVFLQNIIYNMSDNSVPLSPTPTPLPPNYYLFLPPSLTPTPQPTQMPLPVQKFNKLIINETSFSKTNFHKVITDQIKINKLYEDIKSLPYGPTVTVHCPMDNGTLFTLDFLNDAFTFHAVYRPTGCRGVSFTNYRWRIAFGPQGDKFSTDFSALLN